MVAAASTTSGTAVADLARALSTVVDSGAFDTDAEAKLLAAVSRCLCSVLHAARPDIALRLTLSLDELLRQSCGRDLTTEVCCKPQSKPV